MKRIYITFCLTIIINIVITGQELKCPDCQVSLIKDNYAAKADYSEKLYQLNILSKESYEELKKESSEGTGIGLQMLDVPGLSVSHTNSYQDFTQKRDVFFQQNQYTSFKKSAQAVNIVSNSPVAYNAWSECIKNCYLSNSNLVGVFGYRTYSDSNEIHMNFRYCANGLSRDTATTIISVDNGVIYYLGIQYNISITLKFLKNEEAPIIIKRINKLRVTTISVKTINGGPAENYEFTVERIKPIIDYSFKLSYTLWESHYVFEKHVTETCRSPELNEVQAKDNQDAINVPNSIYFARGKYVAAYNYIDLPELEEGEVYRNFTNVTCWVDNAGACAWSMNQDGGLRQRITVEDDNTNAEVQFVTGSRACTWIWGADVYKLQSNLTSPINKNYNIRSKSFSFTVPVELYAGIGVVNIDSREYAFNLGKNSVNGKVRFVSRTSNGYYITYVYELNI